MERDSIWDLEHADFSPHNQESSSFARTRRHAKTPTDSDTKEVSNGCTHLGTLLYDLTLLHWSHELERPRFEK